jgi:preprotein translocase subunit SecF
MRIFANANYNFIRWRWHALILSLVLIWAGVGTIYLKGGVPLGIEFTGGTAIVLKFSSPWPRTRFERRWTHSPRMPSCNNGDASQHEIAVRLPIMKGQEEGTRLEDDAKRIEDAMRAANVGQFEVRSKDSIGPVMGKDYQSKGIWATAWALAGILVRRFPVQVHLRGRRDRGGVSRHPHHGRLPDLVRLRPVPERHCRPAHHHRVFGQ